VYLPCWPHELSFVCARWLDCCCGFHLQGFDPRAVKKTCAPGGRDTKAQLLVWSRAKGSGGLISQPAERDKNRRDWHDGSQRQKATRPFSRIIGRQDLLSSRSEWPRAVSPSAEPATASSSCSDLTFKRSQSFARPRLALANRALGYFGPHSSATRVQLKVNEIALFESRSFPP
jgi:hypothetical protein